MGGWGWLIVVTKNTRSLNPSKLEVLRFFVSMIMIRVIYLVF